MDRAFHPLADLFPLIEGAEFAALVRSIQDNGLREPIILLDDAILDGRNRYRACREAGVDPRFDIYTGDDPHAFVADKNIHRRHLNESQRAMIAALMATAEQGHNLRKSQEVEISTSTIPVQRAADLMNVSRDSVFYAKKVLHEGTAEEIAAVRDGKAAASTIAKQIKADVPAQERHLGGRQSPVVQKANVNRSEKLRMKGQTWAHLRDALNNFSSLPRPIDVIPIARSHDRTGLVDAKLFSTLQWLKDFAHEWSKRSENSGETADDADHNSDAGVGG